MLFLTDAGREAVQQLGRQGTDRFASFVADWSDEEAATLADLLEKFQASKAAVGARTPPPSAPDGKPVDPTP